MFQCPPSLDSLNLPPPVIHTECLTRNSCQRGYICRLNRCVGGRALSSRTLQFDSSENDLKMEQCCTDNYLPERCMTFCSFENYNQSSIFRLLSEPNRCPMSSLRIIHFCASQNMDHRRCCQKVFYIF
uniref:DB domain-containing protein n=1 Tax=Caenorhabditis tropicalis TaxID=1561998 RepID=A0A1I7T2F2_9PELO